MKKKTKKISRKQLIKQILDKYCDECLTCGFKGLFTFTYHGEDLCPKCDVFLIDRYKYVQDGYRCSSNIAENEAIEFDELSLGYEDNYYDY